MYNSLHFYELDPRITTTMQEPKQTQHPDICKCGFVLLLKGHFRDMSLWRSFEPCFQGILGLCTPWCRVNGQTVTPQTVTWKCPEHKQQTRLNSVILTQLANVIPLLIVCRYCGPSSRTTWRMEVAGMVSRTSRSARCGPAPCWRERPGRSRSLQGHSSCTRPRQWAH